MEMCNLETIYVGTIPQGWKPLKNNILVGGNHGLMDKALSCDREVYGSNSGHSSSFFQIDQSGRVENKVSGKVENEVIGSVG